MLQLLIQLQLANTEWFLLLFLFFFFLNKNKHVQRGEGKYRNECKTVDRFESSLLVNQCKSVRLSGLTHFWGRQAWFQAYVTPDQKKALRSPWEKATSSAARDYRRAVAREPGCGKILLYHIWLWREGQSAECSLQGIWLGRSLAKDVPSEAHRLWECGRMITEDMAEV